MSSVENKAFTAVKAKKLRADLKGKAAFVITRALHLQFQLKKNNPIITHKVLELNKSIQEFKKYKRKYKNHVNYQVNQVEDLLKEFNTVKSNNDEILLFISVLAKEIEKIRKNLKINEGPAISKVLLRTQEKKKMRNIKNNLILREYVS